MSWKKNLFYGLVAVAASWYAINNYSTSFNNNTISLNHKNRNHSINHDFRNNQTYFKSDTLDSKLGYDHRNKKVNTEFKLDNYALKSEFSFNPKIFELYIRKF